MGVITKVVDSIRDPDIRDYVDNNIDVGFRYCGDWEIEQDHVNRYLNALLLEKAKAANLDARELRDAQHVLKTVTRQSDIRDWLDDLADAYFPVLKSVW